MCGAVVILIFTIVAVWAQTWIPSPITNRDLLDYSDVRTQSFDTRSAAEAYIQAHSDPSGMIPLQSVVDSNWLLVIGIETKEDG